MAPKRYRKGEHEYVDWETGFREVRKLDNSEEKKIKIKMDEDTAMGNFANLGFISHSPDEFIMDFIFMPPGSDKAKVISRIISSPGQAKRFQMALNENIEKYEKKHGRIKPSEKPGKKIGF